MTNGNTPAINEGQFEIAEFRGKEVRKVLHDDEWFFSVVDVIEAVTESPRPRQYWTDLKRKLVDDEDFEQLYANIVQLKNARRNTGENGQPTPPTPRRSSGSSSRSRRRRPSRSNGGWRRSATSASLSSRTPKSPSNGQSWTTRSRAMMTSGSTPVSVRSWLGTT